MLNEQKTGPVASSDGAVNVTRTNKTGAAVLTGCHGVYNEASSRRNIYFSYVAAVAATVPATTFVGNFVWNPPDSGVALSMLKWTSGITVGAAAAELGISLAYCAQATPPTSAPVDADSTGSCFLGASSPSSSKAKAYKDADIGAIPTVVMNLHHITAAIAVTSVDQIGGDFKGLWTVPPGYLIAMAAYVNAIDAAGHYSTMTWEEIPI